MNTNIVNSTKFIDPGKIVGQVDVKEGDKVADFGCGAGFFSIEMAKKVGTSGEVCSIDVLSSALEAVQSRAKNLGLNNIITKRANLEGKRGSELEENSLDFVVVKDMLFQNKNKEAILKEACKVLKSQGKVIVVEWGEDNLNIGPEKNLRISKESLRKLAEKVGFKVERELEAGNFHYAIILSKN